MIQGRGEYVRLALEEAGAGLCRRRAPRQRHGRDDADDGGGEGHTAVRAAVPESRQARDRADRQHPALSRRAPWAGAEGGSRTNCWVHQLQLTIADLVLEIHDTHHPLGAVALLRGPEGARRRSAPRNSGRSGCRNISAISKDLLEANGGAYVTGRRATYVDLSLFQIVEGLRYAFPKRMKAFEREIPQPRRAARPRRGAAEHQGVSGERTADCVQRGGIFRRYKALDV